MVMDALRGPASGFPDAVVPGSERGLGLELENQQFRTSLAVLSFRDMLDSPIEQAAAATAPKPPTRVSDLNLRWFF